MKNMHTHSVKHDYTVKGEKWCRICIFSCDMLQLIHAQLHAAILSLDNTAQQNRVMQYWSKCQYHTQSGCLIRCKLQGVSRLLPSQAATVARTLNETSLSCLRRAILCPWC